VPEVFPHPDHVTINYDTGEVKINGPCSAEEKERVDELLKQKKDYDKEISGLEADLRDKRKARIGNSFRKIWFTLRKFGI